MNEAHVFMERLRRHPVRECGEPMVCVPDAAASAGVLIDFPPGLKVGTFERVFWLRASITERILAVAEAMLARGFLLRIEDAFRSLAVQAQGAQSDFMFEAVLQKVRWELGGDWPSAELLCRRISVLTATTPRCANHMSGSALDISVRTYPGRRKVDRGGPYLEMSEKTPMFSPFISAEARRNREWINEAMAARGFRPYPYEFWHYSHGDADWALITGSDAPAQFGPVDLDLRTGSVTPVTDPDAALLTEAFVADRLRQLTN
jgi:D-alanyl-D-alanine dipeptidase